MKDKLAMVAVMMILAALVIGSCGCASPTASIGMFSAPAAQRNAQRAAAGEQFTWRDYAAQGLRITGDAAVYGGVGYGLYRLLESVDGGGDNNYYGDTYTVGRDGNISVNRGMITLPPAPEGDAE